MLSLISLGRGLWQKFQAAHPVIRWGGAILVGLVALEFIGDEAINLYIKLQTAPAIIEKAKQDAIAAKGEADKAQAGTRPIGGQITLNDVERCKLDLPLVDIAAHSPAWREKCATLGVKTP
jgi:hypothetical protein